MFRVDFLSDSHRSRDSRSRWLEGQRGRQEASELQSRGLRTKRGLGFRQGHQGRSSRAPTQRGWEGVSPRRGGLVLETGVAGSGGIPSVRKEGWDRPCLGHSVCLPGSSLGFSPASLIHLVTVKIAEIKPGSYPPQHSPAAAAAKSLQLGPTPSDPLDGSPPGPPSLGLSRQEQWSGLPFSSQRRLEQFKKNNNFIFNCFTVSYWFLPNISVNQPPPGPPAPPPAPRL